MEREGFSFQLRQQLEKPKVLRPACKVACNVSCIVDCNVACNVACNIACNVAYNVACNIACNVQEYLHLHYKSKEDPTL